jgi:hypothetical protein
MLLLFASRGTAGANDPEIVSTVGVDDNDQATPRRPPDGH